MFILIFLTDFSMIKFSIDKKALDKEFNKIDKDVYKITEGESGGTSEPILLDKSAR